MITFHVQDLMLGSTETIAAISEWVLLELARHPHILQKLQNELDTSVGDDKCIDGKNITDLPYFQVLTTFLAFFDVHFFCIGILILYAY
jgi:cytochrome P450